MSSLPDFEISKFAGLNTEVKDIKTLNPDYAPAALNWITTTEQDAIQLRRGYAPLSETDLGAGKVTGLGVGKRIDGVEVPFFTYGRKLNYYDADTQTVIEIGTDILPEAQDGKDCTIVAYQNLAGSFVYVSSPYMSTLKIPVANPGSVVDQLTQTYRGFMSIHQSRSFLLHRNSIKNQLDFTNPYLSWVDKQDYGDYDQVTKEDVGTGNGSNQTFTGTLAQRTGVRTVFLASIAGAVGPSNSITAITKQSQAGLEIGAHTFAVGDAVLIFGVLGMTEMNSLIAYVVNVGPTSIGIDVDSSAFTTYSSGGTVYKAEVLKDDKNGNLASPEGGTGTINYATGAFSVTFDGTPLNATDLIADYYWEDSTDEGILDYDVEFDTGERVPGSGDVLPQYAGGGNNNFIAPLANTFLSLHQTKTWQVVIPTNDGDDGRLNLPYREKMGTVSPFSASLGALGIYFVDLSNPNKPEFRRLEVFPGGVEGTNAVVPKLLSEVLDLSVDAFDYAIVYEWGDFVLFSCQRVNDGTPDAFNSLVYVYNLKSESWDKLQLFANRFAEYQGALLVGDSISNNVYIGFSGFADGDGAISNEWTSAALELNWVGQKKLKRMVLDGLIQSSQELDVYLSFDDGDFVKYQTISGEGPYVNTGILKSIGSVTMGSNAVGQGGDAMASPFWVEFLINSSRFEYVRLKLVATNVGGVQINKNIFRDIRPKTHKSMPVRIIG